jgi:PIN domain nuclease of toxin-antitoxin system
VTVLDAYAVIAALLGEPAAPEVAVMLRADEPAQLTPLGVAEVLDRLVRVAGLDPEELILDLAELGLADPAALDSAVATRAGLLRPRRYHRTRSAVSLADCVVVEVAREHDAAVATSDPHLLDVSSAEGIAVVALPNAAGERWSPA